MIQGSQFKGILITNAILSEKSYKNYFSEEGLIVPAQCAPLLVSSS